MAVIAITPNTVGVTTLQRTTLTAGPDTLAYTPGANQQLYLANNSGAPIGPVTIVGAGAPALYMIPGTGGTTITPSAGKNLGTVPANTTIEVSLDDLSLYLQGAVTISGGAALIATVLSN
jgi:hypothetical protein